MGNSALEFAVLAHLGGAELVQAELARRSGVAESAVQLVLDPLVARGFVARQPQGVEPPTFRLTMTGVKRLKNHRGRRHRTSTQRLSDDERAACSTALAEQFGFGRIDIAELHRRTDVLLAATTRNDLGPVFEGLPHPVLDRAPAGQPAPGWRSGAAGCTSIVSVFFGLMGLALINGHHDVDDVVFGLLLVGGAVVWNYLVWSWARRRVN
ncbi:DUF1707 domain-containing protein [Kribbella sp. NPDC020789]